MEKRPSIELSIPSIWSGVRMHTPCAAGFYLGPRGMEWNSTPTAYYRILLAMLGRLVLKNMLLLINSRLGYPWTETMAVVACFIWKWRNSFVFEGIDLLLSWKFSHIEYSARDETGMGVYWCSACREKVWPGRWDFSVIVIMFQAWASYIHQKRCLLCIALKKVLQSLPNK